MNEAVLAVVAMVLLLGVVAFGVGHKGWSWGTVIAGVLVILTAPGYLYLALRVVERERVWREKIVKLQNSIVQVRDAMVADQTGPKKGILKLDGKEQSSVSSNRPVGSGPSSESIRGAIVIGITPPLALLAMTRLAHLHCRFQTTLRIPHPSTKEQN